jgi:hypothetical protein
MRTNAAHAGRRRAAGLLSAAALVFVLTAAPSAARAVQSGCRGWRIVPAPNPGGSANLIDALVLPDGTAWAVGFTAPAFGGFGTVALRNTGSGWETVPTPNPDPSSNRLDGLAGVGGDDMWAVGSRSSGTLIEHWDGAAWSVVPVPSPGTDDNNLESVLALGSDDVWAVGYAAESGVSTRTPVATHWNGTEWTSVSTPSISGQLISLAAGSHGRMWAAGYREVPPNTLIERWDGAAWHQVRSEDRPAVIDNALFGVAVDPATDAAWAVGSSATTQSELETLIEQPCATA